MSKTNNETATLRSANKPKASKVRTLSLKNDNDRVRKDAVKEQNTSLLPDGSRIQNVMPTNSAKTKTNTAK